MRPKECPAKLVMEVRSALANPHWSGPEILAHVRWIMEGPSDGDGCGVIFEIRYDMREATVFALLMTKGLTSVEPDYWFAYDGLSQAQCEALHEARRELGSPRVAKRLGMP